jgi:hypothetical protein
MPLMPGAAPKRCRSSSTCGAMPALPAPPVLAAGNGIAPFDQTEIAPLP